MKNLFISGKIGDLTVKNRVVMPPMCMFCTDDNGYPNEFHHTHYLSRAMHNVGMIIVEATAVSKEGRITDTDLGIWDDSFIEPLKKIVDDCHKYDCKMVLQIAHAGRKCSVESEETVAPSAIDVDDRYKTPREMDEQHIGKFIKDMADAAVRADKAGFDAVEIHGAHGYLINQFLSPITNKRSDKYGGSNENRGRLLKEVVEAVRKVFPKEKPIIVRISAEEYHKDGLHPEDLAQIINYIDSSFIDAVDVSTGGVIEADIDIFPGYQTKPAEEIKRLTNHTTISGGLAQDPLLANEIIANNRADFVFIGRGLLNDSAWAIRAQKALNMEPEWPKPYKRALLKLNI